jgi:hypothetical protein
MATHADVAPADLNIFMLHLMQCFQIFLAFSLALFIFIFAFVCAY